MKLRFGRRNQESEQAGSLEQEALESATGSDSGSPWSTTFLVIGSALMGATAIALWNRRTISTLRSQLEPAGRPARRGEFETNLEDEIY
jgi:hypothetical protein